MNRAIISLAAQEELLSIWEYVLKQSGSGEVADRLIDRIFSKSELYSSQPLLGEARPDLAENVRCFVVGSYVVYYRPHDSGLEILQVVHGARDIRTVFREL